MLIVQSYGAAPWKGFARIAGARTLFCTVRPTFGYYQDYFVYFAVRASSASSARVVRARSLTAPPRPHLSPLFLDDALLHDDDPPNARASSSRRRNPLQVLVFKQANLTRLALRANSEDLLLCVARPSTVAELVSDLRERTVESEYFRRRFALVIRNESEDGQKAHGFFVDEFGSEDGCSAIRAMVEGAPSG